MNIRRANNTDLAEIRKLFYETVTTINIRDYDIEQITVWASAAGHVERWKDRIADQYFILAETDGHLAGFASMTTSGYIDLLYVHHEHQGKKIGALLLRTLQEEAERLNLNEIRADVSITARPFFEKHGFIKIQPQSKEVKGVAIVNFLMIKQLPSETE